MANRLHNLLRCLRNKILPASKGEYAPEPGSPEYPPDFSDQTKAIIGTVRQFTMTSPERISALVDAVRYVVKNRIEGAIVECGVWRGGSMMAVALALLECEDIGRELYLYDTFEGMTTPGGHDCAYDGTKANDQFAQVRQTASDIHWSRCSASLEEVQHNLLGTGYPPDRIHFIKGPVEQTLPSIIPADIALLRLDTDWYESTRHEMTHLYPRLSPKGVLIIDDYGHWAGARKAIDEYLEHNALPLLLNRVDYTGRIAVKPDG